jgi:hypothetical protein
VVILDPGAELNSIQYRFEPKFNSKVFSEIVTYRAAVDRCGAGPGDLLASGTGAFVH